jgi:ferric-dicitrate binding protein FerR (iron transport regulator)
MNALNANDEALMWLETLKDVERCTNTHRHAFASWMVCAPEHVVAFVNELAVDLRIDLIRQARAAAHMRMPRFRAHCSTSRPKGT